MAASAGSVQTPQGRDGVHTRLKVAATVCWVVVVAGLFMRLEGAEWLIWSAFLVAAVGLTVSSSSRRRRALSPHSSTTPAGAGSVQASQGRDDVHARLKLAATVCWVLVVAGLLMGIAGAEVLIWYAILIAAVGLTVSSFIRRRRSARPS